MEKVAFNSNFVNFLEIFGCFGAQKDHGSFTIHYSDLLGCSTLVQLYTSTVPVM